VVVVNEEKGREKSPKKESLATGGIYYKDVALIRYDDDTV
jgi:hypothetical protein